MIERPGLHIFTGIFFSSAWFQNYKIFSQLFSVSDLLCSPQSNLEKKNNWNTYLLYCYSFASSSTKDAWILWCTKHFAESIGRMWVVLCRFFLFENKSVESIVEECNFYLRWFIHVKKLSNAEHYSNKSITL